LITFEINLVGLAFDIYPWHWASCSYRSCAILFVSDISLTNWTTFR